MIASVDYAKSPDIKQQIQEQPWDLLLVDEIHLCARPHSNVKASKQQKRYELVKDLSKKIENVLFLTATPHNGYSDSFASILEMINLKLFGIVETDLSHSTSQMLVTMLFSVTGRN